MLWIYCSIYHYCDNSVNLSQNVFLSISPSSTRSIYIWAWRFGVLLFLEISSDTRLQIQIWITLPSAMLWTFHGSNFTSVSPDGAGGWGQGAYEVGDVVWNVDGQRRHLVLDGLDRWLRHVPTLLLIAGQGCERDLDVGAGEPETAPREQREGGSQIILGHDKCRPPRLTQQLWECLFHYAYWLLHTSSVAMGIFAHRQNKQSSSNKTVWARRVSH